MKVFIGTNSLANIPQEIYANHRAEWYALGKRHEIVFKDQNGVEKTERSEVFDWSSKRFSIDRMRNTCAKHAMELECDYLVFVDDDMLLHPGTIEGLLVSNYDIILAHTYIRGYPFQPMAFMNSSPEGAEGISLRGVMDSEIEEAEKTESKILDAYAVGFACCALKVDLLKRIAPPYFVTGPANTEDIYFCIRCKKEIGDEVRVGVHTGFPTAHLVDPLFVHRSNVERLRELYAPSASQSNSSNRGGDRGVAYHERIASMGE